MKTSKVFLTRSLESRTWWSLRNAKITMKPVRNPWSSLSKWFAKHPPWTDYSKGSAINKLTNSLGRKKRLGWWKKIAGKLFLFGFIEFNWKISGSKQELITTSNSQVTDIYFPSTPHCNDDLNKINEHDEHICLAKTPKFLSWLKMWKNWQWWKFWWRQNFG